MRVEYDKLADAAYIYIKYHIKDGEAIKQKHADENIILDFDKKGKLLGVEVLDASKILSKNLLKKAKRID